MKLAIGFYLTVLLCFGIAPIAASANDPSGSSVDAPRSWPMYQYRPTHNAVFPGSVEARWRFDTNDKINSGIAVTGNSVYVDSLDKHLYAIELATGKPEWSSISDDILMSTPVVWNDTVFAGSGSNGILEDSPTRYIWGRPEGDAVFAVDAATGKVKWTFHTVGEDMPSAAAFASTIVFANGDMHAYGVDALTGQAKWIIPMPGITTMASATLAGDSAFLVTSMGTYAQYSQYNSYIYSIDPRTGNVRWRAPFGNPDCSPTVGDGIVFISDSDNLPSRENYAYAGRDQIVALNARDGSVLWKYDGGPGYYTSVGTSERAIAGLYDSGVLYQSLPAINAFAAFDARSGRVKWTIRTWGAVKMSAILQSGRLYFGDTSGLFYTVDANTGALLHAHAFTAPFGAAPPVIIGKTIVLANGKTLFAIPLSDFDPDKFLIHLP
jgi:outer membrane protein assembly factor BamB